MHACHWEKGTGCVAFSRMPGSRYDRNQTRVVMARSGTGNQVTKDDISMLVCINAALQGPVCVFIFAPFNFP